MHILSSSAALALALSSSLVSAKPLPSTTKYSNRSSCTFSGSSGAASAIANKKSCSTITLNSVVVPAGTTLDLTDLEDGTKVVFEGTTTFGYEEWKGPLVSVSGTDITVTGASGAVLDGQGSRWWDGEGSNGGKIKPKFFYAHSLKGKSSINNLDIKNTPVQVYSVDSTEGLTINGGTIDNSDGDSQGGHNTDCFDVGSSSDITISGITCKNQDVSLPSLPPTLAVLTFVQDCLAINSGTDITFTGGTCSGGHGLSIGSVGGRDDNTVSGITIENSSVSDSQNGVRIKTVYDATGSVSDVTYSNINLSGITKYGVVIEQDYENG